MKLLYGLVSATTLVLLALWVSSATGPTLQVDEGPITAPADTYDPVQAGEELPFGFRQLLPRDAILPIYNPSFVSPAEVDWHDDTLVIGVEMGGAAKAYPVSFLNRREMVIDWIAGTPILVSW